PRAMMASASFRSTKWVTARSRLAASCAAAVGDASRASLRSMPRLAARHVHVALCCGRGPARDAEIMREWLGGQRAIQQRIDAGHAPLAEGGLEIDMRLMAQTHIDTALTGEAHAVATGAEILRQRGDEA